MEKPKYLKNPKTGVKFPYTELLNARGDLTPVYKEEVEEEEKKVEEETKFKCEICGKGFKSKRALDMHIRVAHEFPKASGTDTKIAEDTEYTEDKK